MLQVVSILPLEIVSTFQKQKTKKGMSLLHAKTVSAVGNVQFHGKQQEKQENKSPTDPEEAFPVDTKPDVGATYVHSHSSALGINLWSSANQKITNFTRQMISFFN